MSTPPSTPTKPQTARSEGPKIDPSQGAAFLRESYPTSVLASLAGAAVAAVGMPSVTAYHAELHDSCQSGGPGVERLLTDQMIWAQHRLADLLVESKQTEDPEHIQAYVNAAARLMSEVRKTVLALKEYRTPARTPTNLTVVAGNQVAVMDGNAECGPGEKSFDGELVRPESPQLDHVLQNDDLIPKPFACNGRAAQAAARAHA